MEATQPLSDINEYDRERFKLRAREKFRRDMEHNRIMGIRMALGEERLRIANVLLNANTPVDLIMDATSLSSSEIDKLRQVTV